MPAAHEFYRRNLGRVKPNHMLHNLRSGRHCCFQQILTVTTGAPGQEYVVVLSPASVSGGSKDYRFF